MMDRVGIGWRPELAASIFSNLENIDVVEVVADDYFRAPKHKIQALKTLRSQVSVVLHGVSLGPASCISIDRGRLGKLADLVATVQPEFWSEHLAFVRAGGVEIGHLAAPPRTSDSINGAVENIRVMEEVVGLPPLLENIATLIEPPASTLNEATWITKILEQSDKPMLLDLHNLYANALNFGYRPQDLLLSMPLHRVSAVHISGGRWISEPAEISSDQRLLDDHVHDVPADVYELLKLLAQNVSRPLTVILERDGNYPSFSQILLQLDLARSALREGRMEQEKTRVAA